jgi:hypothetical protein
MGQVINTNYIFYISRLSQKDSLVFFIKMKQFSILFFIVLANSIFAQNKSNFSFIALGDVPYKIPNDYQKLEILIDTIDKIDHQFNFFLGDFKSSKTPCVY